MNLELKSGLMVGYYPLGNKSRTEFHTMIFSYLLSFKFSEIYFRFILLRYISDTMTPRMWRRENNTYIRDLFEVLRLFIVCWLFCVGYLMQLRIKLLQSFQVELHGTIEREKEREGEREFKIKHYSEIGIRSVCMSHEPWASTNPYMIYINYLDIPWKI